jgi:hypothetical protein
MTASEDRERSLKLLERCLTLKADEEDASRQQRLDDLIAEFRPWDRPSEPTMEFAAGWRFCVPSSFRAALDIKLTPRKVRGATTMKWTQGSWFHFDGGDALYDSPKAYLPWDLKNFQICLDIRRASPAQPPNSTDRLARYPGVVIFDVLTPNEERTELVKRRETAVSQDEFVKLLIVGPPPEWREFLV